MNSNYVVILADGEKITIEAYSCEIIDDCPDRIEEPEESENNKIVVFNNFENIII